MIVAVKLCTFASTSPFTFIGAIAALKSIQLARSSTTFVSLVGRSFGVRVYMSTGKWSIPSRSGGTLHEKRGESLGLQIDSQKGVTFNIKTYSCAGV